MRGHSDYSGPALDRRPYFKGQTPSPCGCYYPDVTRIRDERERRMRILYCVFHGEVERPWPDDQETIWAPETPIPSDAWRENKRTEIRDKHSEDE